MIKDNELRIGSWIEDTESKKQYQIEWLSKGCGQLANPIPLTPEILEACGFKKNKEYWMNEWIKLWPGEGTDKAFYHINSDLLIHFDYVHQLQNFYFSVTGEELTVNLNVAATI